MTNGPTQQSSVRQPRGIVRVTVSGKTYIMPGWLEWEVNNNNFASADTFRISFALGGLPAQFNANWWAAQQSITLEILAGFPKNPSSVNFEELSSLIVGKVDGIEVNMASNTLEAHGRDLTSLLIDTKVTEKYQNQNSSDIAISLAKRHGLTPSVTPTGPKEYVGGFYEIDAVTHSYQQTEWDMLNRLARLERFVVYVSGTTLYFGPLVSKQPPYALNWVQPDANANGGYSMFNGMSLSLSRNLTVANGIVVEVLSRHIKTNKSYTATYPKQPNVCTPEQVGTPAPKLYSFNAPATYYPDQVDKMAEAMYHELIRHEMNLSAELPADNVMAAGMQIQLTGTGLDFDQLYWADSVVRRMSMHEGYIMHVSAKNAAPDLPASTT